jgi:hypothetical protein
MSSTFTLKYGLIATRIGNQYYIQGNTYNNRDLLKSMGAKWSSVDRMWLLSTDTDIGMIRRPVQPTPSKWARGGGKCCSKAIPEIDNDVPQGPLWYSCPVHGKHKSNYTGD